MWLVHLHATKNYLAFSQVGKNMCSAAQLRERMECGAQVSKHFTNLVLPFAYGAQSAYHSNRHTRTHHQNDNRLSVLCFFLNITNQIMARQTNVI